MILEQFQFYKIKENNLPRQLERMQLIIFLIQKEIK